MGWGKMGGAIVLLVRESWLNNDNVRILAVSCPAWWGVCEAEVGSCVRKTLDIWASIVVTLAASIQIV